MKVARFLPFAVVFILIWCVIFAFSCSPKIKSQPEATKLNTPQRVVILPFKDQSALKGKDVDTKCAVCGSVFTTGKVAAGAVSFLTKKTTAYLHNRNHLTVVPNDLLESTLIELQLNNHYKNKPKNVLIGAVGAELGADIVISGNIYRYEERIGTPLAADTPASVGFDIYMISAPEGRLLWHARFDETQSSLFENLLKLKTFVERKGKWLTAAELAEYGLNKVLERSPLP